jgi:hypothetical protein
MTHQDLDRLRLWRRVWDLGKNQHAYDGTRLGEESPRLAKTRQLHSMLCVSLTQSGHGLNQYTNDISPSL